MPEINKDMNPVDGMKKKVLIVAKNPVGGIRTYFKYVYSSPVFDQYKFLLITPDHGLRGYIDEVFKDKDYEYIETDDANWGIFKSAYKALSERNFDILHTHGFTTGLILSFLAFLYRVSHIMTAHDVILDWQMPGFKGWLKSKAIGIGFRMINVIMAVGKDAGNNLVNRYPELKAKEKLVVIRNGIDVEYFLQKERRNLKQELDLHEDTVLFGFFGRFMPQKGFGYLADAVDFIQKNEPHLQFAIACFGQGAYIREEREALRNRGLEKWFHFMPHTREMPAALRGVDSVVMPSLWEACPLLPMEAMVAGVPVIGSDCIGLKEVIEGTPALMFKMADSESLAKAMIEFAKNKDFYKEVAEDFVAKAVKDFDVKKSVVGLQNLYQKVLSGHRLFQLS